MKSANRFLRVAAVLAMWAVPAFAQSNDLDQAASDFLGAGYPTPATSQYLKDEFLLESAVQTYLWALPALDPWLPCQRL
jgi:hypothetical protein